MTFSLSRSSHLQRTAAVLYSVCLSRLGHLFGPNCRRYFPHDDWITPPSAPLRQESQSGWRSIRGDMCWIRSFG
jgi:hypothetical protein